MKKLTLWVICVTLIMLAGCKSDRPDMSGLLKTVPSSAGAVVGVNLKSLAEDAGCKISGNEIKPGKEVEALLEKIDNKDRSELVGLFAGESGIVPQYAIVFEDANRMFLTLSLYDVDKFKSLVKNEKESDFNDSGNGVTVCENIAVKGNQAWICLSSAKRIDPDAIIGYSGLSKSQSFLNTDMAKVILESENDIVGWGNFNTVMSNILTRQNMSILSIASGFLFEDVDALQFTMDFKKGEMEASAFFLDENGDPAKYLLPAEKINGKALKELGGSCDMLVAFTITPKLVQKIEKLGTALGGGFFGDLKEVLKNIDGTVAFATSSGNSDYNGLLTTSGPVSDDLKRLFSQNDIPTKEDGDYLRFSKGNVTGGITLDDCAALLKGYTIGLVADFQGMKKAATDYASLPSSMSTVVVGFAPESGSLKLNLELKTADEKENFLLSAIKAM